MAIRARARQVPRGKAVLEPLIGSFLLESITTGMYVERKNAIREYVQNSFDGIQSAIATKVMRPAAGKITITMSEDATSLTIHDNGIELPQRIAVTTLIAVGASRKERGIQVGFRGIGRLAGIAFSRTLQFRTKAAGEDVETIVWFDCDALRRPAHDLPRIRSERCRRDRPGTRGWARRRADRDRPRRRPDRDDP